ncbi:MAG: asparagine synthase (glutamine-hydrolyzing), partial [Alphaproteobacteria bacterium]
DRDRETLFLARDRVGKKPLYYARLDNGLVVFGSELKALLRHPAMPRQLDPRAIEEYFSLGYIPDPRTIYRGIAKLPPAHVLSWRRGGGPELAAYWDLSFTPHAPCSTADAEAELASRLREAIRLRLVSDVPLGAFLSGGVDSSGVVALMSELSPDPVRTFSLGFGHRAFDETAFAREMAVRYGTEHHERTVDPDSFDLVDRLAGIYDEPFGDSSAMPTLRVSALAREKVTVALSGDGGDELFAGYRRYPWHCREEKVRRLLPAALRRPLFGALGAIYPKLDWAPQPLRARTILRELACDSVAGYFGSVSVLDDATRNALFSHRMHSDLQGYSAEEVLRHHMENAPTDDPLQKVQYADFKTWLPGRILVKVDRASMANSLEVRSPLLDHDLVEWGLGLPSSLKLSRSGGKYLLKRALKPYVPHRLLHRPKQGFTAPLAAWFRGPLRERVQAAVSSQALGDCGCFDVNALRRMAEQHQSGLRDHSAALWVVLMFESFLRVGG